MTTMTDLMAPTPGRPWLRGALAVVAALELLEALSGAPNIFVDYHHDTALLKFAQGVTSVQLALAPFVAGAALVLAAGGRLRAAILALAALTLMVWVLDDLPSIPIHGFEFSADYGGVTVLIHRVVNPAAAVAGAALAWKDRRLPLAGLLVSVPTIVRWLGVLAFAVGVMLYGF